MTQNPLLAPVSDLVDYAAVTPAHIVPAVEELLGIARQAVEHAADPSLPATWEAVAEPLDTASERLWRAWSVAGHLNAVVNTPELREAYNAALPLVTEFSTWVGLHEGLYKQYQRLAAAPDFAAWTPVRRRIVEMLRDFRLSGVELQGADRERYAAISDREAQASQKFSENVLDAIDAWSLFVEDEARLAGIPADVLAAARAAAEEDGKPGWKLTLKMPCYLPVMQYARDRDLREALYRGYGTVASEQGDAQFDNSPLIEELLSLRAEEAGLLGLGTFAGLRLQTRMARDAREVTEFLRDLAARAKPYAQRDRDRAARLCRRRAGPGRTAALGRALCLRAPARIALRLLGRRGQAVLHRAARAGRPVRGHRDPVQRAPGGNAGIVLARRRARRARGKPRGRADRPSVPGPVRARRQAERRLGRQRTHPPPGRRTPADAGGLPDLQFRAPTASAPPC